MDLLTRDELKALTKNDDELCVSIYLPTIKAGSEVDQGRIRLKNLIREAQKQLASFGVSDSKAEDFLQPAQKLVDDTFFWQHQSNGLAIFVSQNRFHYFQLPINFNELVVVTDKFHVKPMLQLFSADSQYYVLALSQQKVKLLHCTQFTYEEVELEDVPDNIAEALWYDDPEKQLQYHSSSSGNNADSSIYHGHGVGTDEHKNNILRFFRKIDDGINDQLDNQDIPLIVACVDYLMPIYQDANTYPNLIDDFISGNPDNKSMEELHKEGWDVIEPYFKATQEEVVNKYNELSDTDNASNRIDDIAPAAYNGRVESLFVAKGVQEWGTYHKETNKIDLHPSQDSYAEDLLDFSAIHALMTGAKVFVVEADKIPGNKPYAALFRY